MRITERITTHTNRRIRTGRAFQEPRRL